MNAGNRMAICTVALLGFGATAYAQAATMPAGAFKIQETLVGPVDDTIAYPTISPDGLHAAYIEVKGGGSRVVLDAKPGKEYDQIGQGPGENLFFSPDGRHLAYAARIGKKFVVVWDGLESAEYDLPGAYRLTFSPDGKHLWYLAGAGGNLRMFVFDGKAGPAYDAIAQPINFSADYRHWVYAATMGQKQLVVVDGRPGPEYDEIEPAAHVYAPPSSAPFISADGKHVLYAHNGNKWVLVKDGRESDAYDDVFGFALSPDGKHLAYGVEDGGRFFEIVDGQPGPVFTDMIGMSPVFSSNGKHLAYAGVSNGKWTMIMDGKPGPAFDGMGSTGLHFSTDGEHWGYMGRTPGSKWRFIVIDGQASAQFSDIDSLGPIFSADSQHVAYSVMTATHPAPQSWGMESWIVLDGHKGSTFYQVTGMAFSPDGKHFAYQGVQKTGFQTGTSAVVLDGQTLQARSDGSMVGWPLFSPDSKHLAYIFSMTSTGVVGMDGKDGKAYPGVYNPNNYFINRQTLVFSPDSRHLAYVVRNEKKEQFVVLDGQDGAKYKFIWEKAPAFDPDGSLEYLAVRDGGLYHVKCTPEP